MVAAAAAGRRGSDGLDQLTAEPVVAQRLGPTGFGLARLLHIGELPAVRVPAQAEEAAGFGYSLLDLDLDRADPFPVGSVATS